MWKRKKGWGRVHTLEVIGINNYITDLAPIQYDLEGVLRVGLPPLRVSVSYLRAPGLIIISPGCVNKIEYVQNYMQSDACISYSMYGIGISSYLPVYILYVNC